MPSFTCLGRLVNKLNTRSPPLKDTFERLFKRYLGFPPCLYAKLARIPHEHRNI